MKRLWHAILDLVDAVLAGAIYGRGGSVIQTPAVEAEKAAKQQAWAAGASQMTSEPDEPIPDLETRLHHFRQEIREEERRGDGRA